MLSLQAVLIISSLVGWCGTVPRLPHLPPKPDPDPWPWWKTGLVGIVGGIAGGLLTQALSNTQEIAGIGFGALAGGRILSDFASGFFPGKG
jgi:hypothetical protein